ncbi:hypothetical protein RchiOBHm_Chr7g0212811 [Rosa chinensis]|uniref:Uncharacterized protein n=1 Tax=Rosa chinensis TaxID=74649 RepID=A0A2P6PAU1_ROSCH|nr:hypothetical protein RchiOBHm_Chr7g0212811 [Rosa chinensis]
MSPKITAPALFFKSIHHSRFLVYADRHSSSSKSHLLPFLVMMTWTLCSPLSHSLN